MGFYLSPKKVLLPVETWGMRMQWEHTTFNIDKAGGFSFTKYINALYFMIAQVSNTLQQLF